MSLAMSPAEREAFLADVHVAVVSIPEPGRGGLVIPIWYDYAPGGPLWFVTDATSRKARLLERAGCLGLCAQGPNVMLYPQSVWFSGVTPADLPEILAAIERAAESRA